MSHLFRIWVMAYMPCCVSAVGHRFVVARRANCRRSALDRSVVSDRRRQPTRSHDDVQHPGHECSRGGRGQLSCCRGDVDGLQVNPTVLWKQRSTSLDVFHRQRQLTWCFLIHFYFCWWRTHGRPTKLQVGRWCILEMQSVGQMRLQQGDCVSGKTWRCHCSFTAVEQKLQNRPRVGTTKPRRQNGFFVINFAVWSLWWRHIRYFRWCMSFLVGNSVERCSGNHTMGSGHLAVARDL